jgi:phenylpropionate dioxygenase-like ring-hydroxylating dioxygenase large terminal subunit
MLAHEALKKYWFPVSRVKALKKGQINKVIIFNIPLIIWKTQNNHYVCIEDRCPHRGFPLSQGKLTRNGNIQCPYHGWVFNEFGVCTHIPAEGPQCQRMKNCLQTFQVKESEGLLWIHAAKLSGTLRANICASPPDFSQDRFNGYRYIFKFLKINASLDEVVENFIDSAHTPFVHKGLIRGHTEPQKRQVRVLTTPETVQILHEPTQEKVGLLGKILNPQKEAIMHIDKFQLPGVIEVKYFFGTREVFKTQIFCVTNTTNETSIYIFLGLNFGRIRNKILSFLLWPLSCVVLYQDLKILEALNANKKRFQKRSDIFLQSDTGLKHVSEMIKEFLYKNKNLEPEEQEKKFHMFV